MQETLIQPLEGKLFDRIVAFRRDMHQHPELSWEESRAAKKIAAFLDDLGIDYETGIANTGIVADLPGVDDSHGIIALRADIDALPIHEETGLPFSSEYNGVMHACGHDGHTSILLGAASLLANEPDLPVPIRLIFQPAEETGRGAKAMIEAGALEGVAMIFGGHIDRHYPLGTVIVSDGAVNASSDQFSISISGKGGHGGRPHETVDAVVVGSLLVTALQTIVSRNVNPAHPSVVSVGTFEAGTAPNVIADHAKLSGTIRAQDPEVRSYLHESIRRISDAVGLLHGADIVADIHVGTPPVINPPGPAEWSREAAISVVGPENVRHMEVANMGAEDFAYYLEKIPGCYVRFGTVIEGVEAWPAHSSRFDFDERTLGFAASYYHALAKVAGRRLVESGKKDGQFVRMMITVREAAESDAETIRDIFMATYQGQYAHPEFFDAHHIKRLIFDDDVLVLVAEEADTGQVLGTGSVILDIGAFGDLIGEFGRLAVDPGARGGGVGTLLMEGRLERIEDRLHIAIVENRAVHPFSQKISAKHQFFPVGLLPSKFKFAERENIALYARLFSDCLPLRKNNPHIIPEAYPLADAVLQGAGLPSDVIVDDEAPAYAPSESFDLEALTSRGYTSLLHFERGRIGHREIIGPVKLHAGIFQLRVSHYEYLLARRNGHLTGGIGYHIDPTEEAARILELVSADDKPVRFLLDEVVKICEEDAGVKYLEVDVNAHAPAMQRTLLELGFLPAAYIPAMAFHRVERLDVIRMVRLFTPLDIGKIALHETTQPVADVVIAAFQQHQVDPGIATAVSGTVLFKGLNEEQTEQLAAICTIEAFEKGQPLSIEGETDGKAFLILRGRAEITLKDSEHPVGSIGPREMAGELSLNHGQAHHATITAAETTEAAVLHHDAVEALIRRRPDIGVLLNRNLADQLGEKLMRVDRKKNDS